MPLVPELVVCEGTPWPSSPRSYHPATDLLSRCPKRHTTAFHYVREVNALLAKVAKPGEPVPTSRSLKATCLSWVAKAGVSPPLRKLLGYHVDATELSVNTYSRDLLAPPLRELVRVLSLIASGAFSPDTTRSGYFAFNDPGTQEGNGAASAVLPRPSSEGVSAGTGRPPVASDQRLRLVVLTEEDLGDPDESPAAALAAFKQSAPEVADHTHRRRRL